MNKKCILITAHPDKESLCYENAQIIQENLKHRGYEVVRFEAFDYPLTDQHPLKGGIPKIFDTPANAFIGADLFVVCCPMWNFSIPGGLKNFLDGAVQARKAFRFKKIWRWGMPVGLLKAKKVVCVWTCDGPRFAYEFWTPWNGVKHRSRRFFLCVA